jgi:hypothetical protein
MKQKKYQNVLKGLDGDQLEKNVSPLGMIKEKVVVKPEVKVKVLWGNHPEELQ